MVRTVAGLLRGRFAADVVATLAIVAALLLGEPLAGLLVILMQSGGEALERHAAGRASAAVRALEAEAPRIGHRLGDDGSVTDLPVDRLAVGDRVRVLPGELIPCDGRVLDGAPLVDLARITGEPLPVRAAPGMPLPSGATVLDGPLSLQVGAPASESQYARIVTLVRTAQQEKAPLQRLADRAAAWFTPATLLVCAAAWFVSRDPARVLAVLVVATPCPLILATPVAIIGGINRAARRGILFRRGAALEQLAGVDMVAMDKTGTITLGRPDVFAVHTVPGASSDELLALAASIERGSGHLLARGVVRGAEERGLPIAVAEAITEDPGHGISGRVSGRSVAVGSRRWIDVRATPAPVPIVHADAGTTAIVAVDGRIAGEIVFADHLRPGIGAFLATLRGLGVRRLALLSGDDRETIRRVAEGLDYDDVAGELRPEEKAARIGAWRDQGHRVAMLGDGTNDAPALGTAAVGVALAAGGGGITAETADVVLLVDAPERLAEAIVISRRTMRIAKESITVGLGLSIVAMLVAASGGLSPVAGALLQEGIDVAVILNALRAARA